MCVVVDADLEQQEAGQVTGVGGFFTLEKDQVYITTEHCLFSMPSLLDGYITVILVN